MSLMAMDSTLSEAMLFHSMCVCVCVCVGVSIELTPPHSSGGHAEPVDPALQPFIPTLSPTRRHSTDDDID